eukprot:6368462-Amphidinium_carterae.1
MVKCRHKRTHNLLYMCTWARQSRPFLVHIPHSTGPGEAWVMTSPSVLSFYKLSTSLVGHPRTFVAWNTPAVEKG